MPTLQIGDLSGTPKAKYTTRLRYCQMLTGAAELHRNKANEVALDLGADREHITTTLWETVLSCRAVGLKSFADALPTVELLLLACLASCADTAQVPNGPLLLSKNSCSASIPRASIGSSAWANDLEVTACIPQTAQREYVPGDDDAIVGALAIQSTGGGEADIQFAFALEGSLTTSPESVAQYVRRSEYAAIADPRSRIRGDISDLMDDSGRRGSIVRWQDPAVEGSADAFNHAFGAFLSEDVVVLFELEEGTPEVYEEMLARIFSIVARRTP